MLLSKIQKLRVRKGIFHSFRFQLAFVFLCGIIVPTLLAVGVSGTTTFSSLPVFNSVVLASIAALALVCIIRQLGLFPGTGGAKYILPAHAMIYAVVLGVIVVFRLEYSNRIIVLAFLGTLWARYAVAALNIRGPQQIYYIVPGGRASVVEELRGLITVRLDGPKLPDNAYAAVIADLHYDHPPEWERFLAEAAITGTPVYHYKQVWEATTGQVRIEHLSENSFGSLLPGLAYRKIKRLADLSLCVLVLPVVVPLMLVTALLIKLGSPGSVFFRQERMGYRGKTFRVCKFRTMFTFHNANDRNACRTQADDVRVTRAGRFLRRTRIDELPQMWNILRGEMSWIGPRPEAISLSQWYESELPFYSYRHIVRPGISGWAQVNQGHVSSLSEVDQKLQFDFYYIKHISYWLDILIFFRTVRVVLSGFGAR